MPNMYCLSQSYSIPFKKKECALTNVLSIIFKSFLGRHVVVGDSVVVVAFVSVFSKSYLFASKTKLCTLANMLIKNLQDLLRW